MVEDSGIVAVARHGATRPPGRTIAPVVAASDSPSMRGGHPATPGGGPPHRRSRTRRGAAPSSRSTARLVRGAALLLVPPLLLLAFTIARPGPVPRVAAAAVVRRVVRDGARGRARAGPPRSRPRVVGRRRRGGVGEGEARPLRPRRRSRTPGTRRSRGSARVRLRNLVTVVPGATPDAILVSRPSGQSRRRARRERQRLRDRSADRARPRLRPPRHDRGPAGAAAHADLPLLGRRRVRRLRRRAVRLDLAVPRAPCAPSSRSTGSPARRGRGSSWRVSRHARRPRRSSGPPTSGSQPSSAGLRRGPAGLPSSSISGMPFGYGEQAPFLGREISAIRLDDGGRRRRRRDDRHARRASIRTQFVRLGRAAESILASLDGGIELAGGTAGLRLPRQPRSSAAGRSSSSSSPRSSRSSSARSTSSPGRRRRRLPLPGAWRALRDAPRGLALGRARRSGSAPLRASSRGAPRSRRRPTARP